MTTRTGPLIVLVLTAVALSGCGSPKSPYKPPSATTATTATTGAATTTAVARTDAQVARTGLPASTDLGASWKLVQEFVREPADLQPNACLDDRSLDAITGQASREFTRDLNAAGLETAHLYTSINLTHDAALQARRRTFFESAKATACAESDVRASVPDTFPGAQVQKVTTTNAALPAPGDGFGRHIEAQFALDNNVYTLAVDQYRVYAGRLQGFVEYQTCNCARLPEAQVSAEEAQIVKYVAARLGELSAAS